MMAVLIKSKRQKKVIKQEIKFEDHENCLQGNQLEKKRKKI